MSSIFAKIINAEIPAHKIAEDDQFLAFLDIRPLQKGHTLVIPKIEVDDIFDLEDELLAGLHLFAKRVAKAIRKTIACKKIGVAVIGLEVPHAHIHLVPINAVSELSFKNPPLELDHSELVEIAQSIRANFE